MPDLARLLSDISREKNREKALEGNQQKARAAILEPFVGIAEKAGMNCHPVTTARGIHVHACVTSLRIEEGGKVIKIDKITQKNNQFHHSKVPQYNFEGDPILFERVLKTLDIYIEEYMVAIRGIIADRNDVLESNQSVGLHQDAPYYGEAAK